ncbi:EG95 [Echinococcus multilocularis]|uniref:EG95 n=1 Tax=Echinococcus multilocularis TaxID=6211 RepID=A0A068YBJ1_ECHMU|nr:EG95 [Echinococcus multilocularis]
MPNGGTCRSLAKAPGPLRTSLPQHFKWSHVGTQNITLSWNVKSLGEEYAEEIELTAVSVSYFGFYTFSAENFLLGNVTVVGLKPNSTYDVTAEAVGKRGTIFTYKELITTPSHESAVTSSASALTSSIFGVVFSCTAMVLASNPVLSGYGRHAFVST